MKRLFTTFLLLMIFSTTVFSQILERKAALHPDGWQPKAAPGPFLLAKNYVPMGLPLVHDPEALSYFSPSMLDASGQLVANQYTTFRLPDTLSNLTFSNPAGNGTYYRNEYMERFTAADVNFYLDSVVLAFFADTVPVKLTCWVMQDTLDSRGNPAPNIRTPLAVASILKSQIRGRDDQGRDSLTVRTVPFKHLLIKANDVSPNSFYVSLSTVTITSTATGAPFFGNPSTKNRINVLTDNTTDNSGRATDYTIDRMHWTATRTDGTYVAWNNIAHQFFLTAQTTATDTAWLYPNMFMIAYVSYNSNGVGDTKLIGNALAQNYPNPFNPSTVIKFSLEKEAKVSIKLYNALGLEVATILDANQGVGENQVTFNGDNLPSGTYFYTMKAGTFSQTKRMVLSK